MASPSPKLIVISGEGQGTVLEVSRALAVGSHRDSDLHLRDAGVSWTHARIWPDGEDVFLEDLGSSTGTLLNGNPVKAARLRSGDTITVGSSRMTLSGEDDQQAAPAIEADKLQKETAELRDSVEAERKASSDLRQELEKAQAALAAAEARAVASERKVSAAGKKAKAASEDQSRTHAELEGLRRRDAEAAKEASGLQVQLEGLRRREAEVTKSASGLEVQLEELRGELARSREDRAGQDRLLAETREASDRASREHIEKLAAAQRQIEASRVRLAAAKQRVKRERKLREGDQAELATVREALSGRDERVSDLGGEILGLEREKLALRAQCEDEGRRIVELEKARGLAESARQRLAERLESLQSRQNEDGRRIVELETRKQALEDRVREGLEGARALEAELASVRELMKREEEAFHSRWEEAERSHKADLEALTTRERERQDALEREGREQASHYEARIQELAAERDKALGRITATELRVSELEVILERERESLATWTKAEETARERIAELESVVRGLRKDKETLGARIVELESSMEETQAKVAREQEDIAWKNGELDRLRLALSDVEREHRAEVADLRTREAALTEDQGALRAEIDALRNRHEKDLAEVDALRADLSKGETEISMLRGYLEELKEKVRAKEREVQSGQEQVRREVAEQSARLMREKRKLEALVRELGSGRALDS